MKMNTSYFSKFIKIDIIFCIILEIDETTYNSIGNHYLILFGLDNNFNFGYQLGNEPNITKKKICNSAKKEN